MKIALLEDDQKISQHLKRILEAQGWSVQTFLKISDLLDILFIQSDFDVLILDRLLSDGDSVDHLKKIKVNCVHAKIIILSSIDFPKEKAKWLGEGADEYMGKPVFSDELIVRIKLLVARSVKTSGLFIDYKDMKIDKVDRVIFVNGKRIDFSAKEFNLLLLLLDKPGRIYNKFQILEHVWGYDSNLETNVVESTLNHLRRKLEQSGSKIEISNKRNLGYWVEG